MLSHVVFWCIPNMNARNDNKFFPLLANCFFSGFFQIRVLLHGPAPAVQVRHRQAPTPGQKLPRPLPDGGGRPGRGGEVQGGRRGVERPQGRPRELHRGQVRYRGGSLGLREEEPRHAQHIHQGGKTGIMFKICSILSIYQSTSEQDPYAKRFLKDVKTTKTSYIANSGGILGLCMGFSLISGAEILFHCFLGIFPGFNEVKKKVNFRKVAIWSHAYLLYVRVVSLSGHIFWIFLTFYYFFV